ncbi:rhodanese-related sulfurtransferase [Carboxylicivirga sp. M1479]|uniref:oxygen-dependent tRNA uridine(34) hydroxylase TrhO n=1 Tax=Carboxylicivirga sp. M1479 TaxID=2594476 RepID=UPI00117864E1|nr:rhodanese-related sulfurtransferase [Carboxylicivirga sp. M1479]TRX60901.1 rhodanese-related sulfurtransferase [Carboxylicivirga sp. M1479]
MDPNSSKRHLINQLSPEDLKARLANESFKRTTVSFYKYVILDKPEEMRDQLFLIWNKLHCYGRIYVAKEGINAQMSVPDHFWNEFKEQLYAIPEFNNVPFKIAVEDDGQSFLKLQIKVRQQIVADGLKPEEYDVTNVGQHLNAQQWNNAMDDGAIVVDMRNHYESEIGRFANALLPDAETFKEELPEVVEKLKGKEDEKILLYCTGGVRCEKTSAYLKHHGFSDVNQLLGGIIDYNRQVETEALENKFIGKNFVFDNRLGERISDDVISHCHQCGSACDTHTNCANKRCNVLFIQCDSCRAKYNACCGDDCQTYVLAPADEKESLEQRLVFKRGKRFYKTDKSA